MTYDADGNLTQATDANGTTTTWTYDPLSRKTGEYDGTSATAPPIATWAYDNSNNIPGVSDPIGQLTTANSYDQNGEPFTAQQSGFNVFGESLGETLTVPADQGALARSYAYQSGYSATTGLPLAVAGGEVIELEYGITVYPGRGEHGRWRAVWHENGERQQCEAASEEKLAAKLEKVIERLQADAPNMKRPGAALIAHYLDPDRLPVGDRWSRKHAHTQRRLCERFAAPVIDAVTCQDIKTEHTQRIVNAAPTPGEGDRVHRMISALVSAGLDGGYLANPRLAKVHWQVGSRELPAARVSVAGESALWVDPDEIPAAGDIGRLSRALAAGRHGERDELMANTAAYSGLRWGELAALTIAQVDQATRVITVDRKVVEVAGHLYVEAPKNRKFRRTIYPRRTPAGYLLAERLAARIEAARAEQEAGTNPMGLIFPSPTGTHWRSSNFNRRVLARAYLAARWRDGDGNGRWTWHSLRHVFCTTALFAWKLDPTDVSRMAGHANYRITLDMYVNPRELHQTGEKPQVSRSRDCRNSAPRVLVPAM